MDNFELFYNFAGLNQKLFLIINHTANISILPYCLQFLSWFFAIQNFACYYIIYCIYFYIKLRRYKTTDSIGKEFWYTYNKLTLVGIIYAMFGFIYAALKFSVNIPRPFCSMQGSEFVTVVNTALERCESGFPSAHTGLAVIIAYSLWEYLNQMQKVSAIVIITLVGIARVALAMHYPADVIYSLPIAALVIIIGNLLFRMFKANIIQFIGKIILSFVQSQLRAKP